MFYLGLSLIWLVFGGRWLVWVLGLGLYSEINRAFKVAKNENLPMKVSTVISRI